MKEKLFELILFIDQAGLMIKDHESNAYQSMRLKHFENCRYLVDNGLDKEYYNYFFERIIKNKGEEE